MKAERKVALAIALGLIGMVAAGCGKEDAMAKVATAGNDGMLKEKFEKIKDYRIFFGHQSVGDNIMAGIEDLKARTGAQGLNVVAWKPGASLPEGYLAHGYVGGNRSPQSKFDDFAKAVDGELAGRLDVAFMKLCYVDIHKETDIKSLFDAYAKTVEGIQRRHPDLTVVHVTTPLMVKEGWSKLKYYVKAVMGVENDNEKRNAFNAMMRERFKGEPIFDLEALEATRPDGRKETFKGGKHLGLAHAWTYDGGHLNEPGRQMVAGELIAFLAALPSPKARQVAQGVSPDGAAVPAGTQGSAP